VEDDTVNSQKEDVEVVTGCHVVIWTGMRVPLLVHPVYGLGDAARKSEPRTLDLDNPIITGKACYSSLALIRG
jgi:hypothetical protein